LLVLFLNGSTTKNMNADLNIINSDSFLAIFQRVLKNVLNDCAIMTVFIEKINYKLF